MLIGSLLIGLLLAVVFDFDVVMLSKPFQGFGESHIAMLLKELDTIA